MVLAQAQPKPLKKIAPRLGSGGTDGARGFQGFPNPSTPISSGLKYQSAAALGKTSPGGGRDPLPLPSKPTRQVPRHAAAKKPPAKGAVPSKYQTLTHTREVYLDDSVGPGALLEDESVANLTFQNHEVKTELRASIKETMTLKKEIRRLKLARVD